MSLKINIARLKNAVGTTLNYELTETKLGLQDDVELTKPLQISLMITNTGRILKLKGNINTEIKARCNRCLVDVIFPINTILEEELVYFADLRYLGDLTEEQIEEKYRIYCNDNIDLTDIIRENLILSLPLKVLCHEKCRGICSKCGQNLNEKKCMCTSDEIDPRLAILAKLKRD